MSTVVNYWWNGLNWKKYFRSRLLRYIPCILIDWWIMTKYFCVSDGYHSSSKMKRSRAGQVKHKSSISLYNKLTDLVGNLAELVEIQELTDTIILQVLHSFDTTISVKNHVKSLIYIIAMAFLLILSAVSNN